MKKDSSVQVPSISRREFLRRSGGCAALTSVSLLSTILTLKMTRTAAAAQSDGSGYKALVCVFQHGGNDSYNMLTPYEIGEYNDYLSVRSNLALPWESLLPITDASGRLFGIHPGMIEVSELYGEGKLAFLANVGSLVEPTDLNSYKSKLNLPLGLFSHSDQQRHWQTSVPQSRAQVTGWAGRMADALTDSSNRNPTVSMNIALNHVNIFQTGEHVIPYVIQDSGATTLNGYQAANAQDRILTRVTDSLLEETYGDLLEKTHVSIRDNSIDAAIDFNNAINAVSLTTPFPFTKLGQQLAMVARTIAVRHTLGQTRQVFFVDLGGWDHHDEVLNNQAILLPQVSGALKAFYDATVELGVASDVTTFTASDFGRTLSSNGNGSDHAWGGNHIIMGGSVAGRRVHGIYPSSLALGNPLDTGRGRLIPTTSVDEYNAELAMWFGIPNDDGLEVILPNIRNFYAQGSSAPPIGFMA